MKINIHTLRGQKEINKILGRYNLINEMMKPVTGQHYKYTFRSHEEILNKVELVKILLRREGIKDNDLNKAQLTIHSGDNNNEFEGLTNITGVFDSTGNFLVTRILPISAEVIHADVAFAHIKGSIFLYSPTMKEFSCAGITRRCVKIDNGETDKFVEAQLKGLYSSAFSEVSSKLDAGNSLPLLFLHDFYLGGKLDAGSNDIHLNVHGIEKLLIAFKNAVASGSNSILTNVNQVNIDMESIAIIMAHHPQPNTVLYAAILETVRSVGIENEYLKLCKQWSSSLI